MEENDRISVFNPLCREKESKLMLQKRLKRRKELEESRKEFERIQKEQRRQKILDESTVKTEAVTPSKSRERRSWILGKGSTSPNQENPSKRKTRKTKTVLTDVKETSGNDDVYQNVTSCPSRSTHNEVYHSSQFQVSDLVSQLPSTKKKQPTHSAPQTDPVFCRICQSDEDTLGNQLVTPCGCMGSMRYVHHLCLQQWRKTKKASDADVTNCELCLTQYDSQILGKTDVKPDQTLKMQEDLRKLVRSGVYLMLLVDFCRDSFENLLQERNEVRSSDSTPFTTSTRPTFSSLIAQRRSTLSSLPQQQPSIEESESSEENEEYVSRSTLKRRSDFNRGK